MSNNFDGPVLLDSDTDYYGFGRAAGTDFSSGPRILTTTGDPNGAVTAPRGSIVLRSGAGAATVYTNIDGVTAWTDIGIAADPTIVIATPYAVLATDTILLVDIASAVINLPAIAALTSRSLTIKDRNGTAEVNPITVNPSGAETIDDAASLVLDSNYVAVQLIGDGTEWSTV